ncbi:DUF4430 domain-containing protein [Collinsella sp. KGMB02528]|uniref:DUF4430 domain-containing protein n=1 Tax=Collinsella acetigenes TaxID=2713419 RepID=A0A7X9UCT7_9ACTN|nr:DUF4430 domain-containing protein [Collinsella acetigenes]
MIGQHPHDGERQPAALSSKEARNRVARTIRNMRIASARVLVAFMTMLMVFGTTPAQLWAEGAEGIARAVDELAATPQVEAAAEDQSAEDAPASDDAAADAEQEPVADEEPAEKAAPEADAAVEQPAAVAPTAVTATGKANAPAIASADELTSEAKVYIQDSKDKDNSYSTKSGALNAGDTLWANMYDEVEDDWYGTLTESVANPGTWTYTWLAGTTRASSNVADYTEVVGHEQSLSVTAAMEGKYFICKVTVDGKDYYGPSVSSGSGINANNIPGPVLGAGQMELGSVKLSSDTPSVGDTLTATPYISSYQQAPADAKVTYTWSASTSKYSGFTKIKGETGATLTLTNDLEGKYIKVEATAGVNTVSKTTSSKVKLAGEVEISAVSIVNTKDNTSVFTVGDTAKARAKETGGAYGAFVDADKLNFQWQSSDTKGGTYTDIAGATGETLELTDTLGGKYLKCKVSSKIGSSSLTNSTGALVAAAGSINVTSVTMSPTSGKVEVGSTITATAKAGSTDVTADSHVSWQWYKGTSNRANSCNTPIEGETGSTLTVTAALKGYYVVAKANGGYGEQKPSYYAAGPVSVAGQVELYDVQFEGSPATNGVHVGDKLKTKVRKKDGSNYNYIDRTDNVTYQWQYANTSSSYDSAYTDIPGATEATYTVDAAYAGKYLRVKVTSENTVFSTQKKGSYSGTQSIAPLGPVTLKGQYKLAGIELADKNVTLSVGSKITPSVQVPGSWSGSTKDVPDDAELTMAWYAKGEGDADWTELTDGIDTTDGSLTITDALVGKKIKVTASALDNTVEWVSSDSVTAAGEYNLLRVTTTPQINSDSIHLVSGDSVKATAQAKRADGSTTNGIDVTDRATVAWYAADDAKAPTADWTLLSDMSGAEATVSASAAGKYLKAVATSGSSTVELVSANPVIAAGSLEAAVQKLNDANKLITVDYSAKGGNVNDVLKAQLADLGFTDIDVKVSEGSVAFKAEDAKATVGISDAQDKTNGDVKFFYIDPNNYTGYNIDGLRSADVVFELSRDGKTEYYQPNKSVQVAWDEAELQDLLDSAAESLQIGYAAGESADGVTQNVTLPYKAGSAKKFSVEWTSSDTERLSVSGYSWEDKTGKVSRASSDRDVTLTAKVTVTSGDIKLAGSHDFKLTVKGDPEKIAADKKALQEKVDAAFTYNNIKYSGTDAVANKDGLTADLQMPRTSTLNIDGKYYKVEYSASTDGITFNGYKGTVYQPLPGAEAAKAKITLTVTDKSNAEVTASKTLDFAIAPQDQGELDAELSLMEKAKAGYAAAILNGQDAAAVTGDMHAFQKAYLDADGNLAWSYNKATTDSTSLGIVPVDLPGYDAMSGQDWRLFKSSNSSIVSAENLKVTQPQYNTKVVVSSRLTSEKYARYAERYPDNATYAKLANQDVSATLTVVGTSGQNSPEVTATCSVIGVDAKGNQQTWTAAEPYTLKTGSTAADLSEALFKKHGLTADYGMGTWGWYLNSVTSPVDAGRTLGYDSQTGAYWQLFINGTAASVGAGDYTLEAGDSVVWCYSKYGDAAPTDQLSVSCEVVGQAKDGSQQTWAQPTTVQVKEGSTAAELSEQVFKQAGIGADTGTGSYGWYLNSLTSPFDEGVKLSTEKVDASTWNYWQFFVNGKLANVGAGNYTLKAGDKVSWVYGSDGTMPGQTKASLQIIGVDSGGNVQTWAPAADYTMVDAATVADATELAFKQSGISADYGTGTWGWFLNSITSPFDGRTLAWDSTTGAYWKLFIDGKPSDLGAGSVKLKDAKSIAWVYTADDKLPDPDALTTDPNAPKSNFDSAWSAFAGGKANGSVVEVPTPSGAAESAWDEPADIKGGAKGVSDLLIIDGNICAVKGDRIVLIDSETGKKELASCSIGANNGYFCRPAYKDGYLVVPFEDGSLGIFVLDKKDGQYSIACRYKTPSLGIKDTQALTSVTISGGKAYAGFTVVDGSEGALVCVDLASGKVDWTTDKKKSETNENEGYYWAGAAASGDDIIIGNESGKVALIDGSNGKELSSVSVGTPVRSGIVAVEAGENGDGTYLAVSRDNGTLYKIRRSGNRLTMENEGKGVAFAAISTSTPAVSNGLAYVCGMDIEGYGTLSVIDLSTMSVKKSIRADKGESKSAPLVSVQGNDTYVYFTCNALPGGVYAYKLGDDAAQMIFTPDAKYREYCTASIICDEKGNLYYANDSGRLFKLAGAESWRVAFDARGGSYVAPRYVAKNKMVSEPVAPTRDGYTFLGWYTAEGKKWDFSKDVVTADMTLYAKWTKNESPVPSPVPSSRPVSTKGNASSTSLVLTSHATVSLAGVLKSNAARQTGEHESLLAGFDSGELETSVEKSSDRGAVAVTAEKKKVDLPTWPFIGIALGVCVVVLIVLKRKKQGGE